MTTGQDVGRPPDGPGTDSPPRGAGTQRTDVEHEDSPPSPAGGSALDAGAGPAEDREAAETAAGVPPDLPPDLPRDLAAVLAAEWLTAAFKRTKWVEKALNWSFAAIFTAFAATILTAQARH